MKMRSRDWFGRLALLLLPCGLPAAEPAQTAVNSSHVYGWIETIRLQPDGVELEAKLDTGADTSSLDARNIELFSRDGEKWVRFRVDGLRQGAGVSQAFERPVLRRIKVRGAGGRITVWSCGCDCASVSRSLMSNSPCGIAVTWRIRCCWGDGRLPTWGQWM